MTYPRSIGASENIASFTRITGMTQGSVSSYERKLNKQSTRGTWKNLLTGARINAKTLSNPGSSHNRFGGDKEWQNSMVKVIRMLHSHLALASTKLCTKDTDDTPLVVFLEIGKYTVKQMLINTGTSNVLFCDAIAQIGIPDSEIRPYVPPLIRFTKWSLNSSGVVNLPVHVNILLGPWSSWSLMLRHHTMASLADPHLINLRQPRLHILLL